MKKIFSILLALALLLAPAAWGTKEALADGPADQDQIWYADFDGAPLTLTLSPDGSYTLALPDGLGETAAETWVLDDGYIRLDDAAALDLVSEEVLVWREEQLIFTHAAPTFYAPAEPDEDAVLLAYQGYWVCRYVDVKGLALPAYALGDDTDLYVNGHSAILGGSVFGDTLVSITGDGPLACAFEGSPVTLALQADGFLRLTLAADPARTFYLTPSYTAALDYGTEAPEA